MQFIIQKLKKFKFLYLLKGYIRIRNKYYFFSKKWYVSPSLRQAQILKSYVTKNKFYKQREEGPNYFLMEVISKNSVIFDIGGNLGYSALHYSRVLNVAGNGKCFSFEPVSKNFSDMIFNFGHIKNIFFFKFGISNKAENLKFGLPSFIDDNSEINTGLYTSKNLKDDDFIEECKVFSLDSFVDFINLGNKSIDYIKIDIEGAELNALIGAKNILSTHQPIIQIEYNKSATDKDNFKSIVENLFEYAYEPFKIKQNYLNEKTGYEVFFIKKNILEQLKKNKFFNDRFINILDKY